jgi:hypothetical protein
MIYNIIVLLGLSASLAASGYGAYVYFDPIKWIRQFINSLPGKIKEFFMWILEAIIEQLRRLWEIIKGIGGKIRGAGESVIRKIREGIEKLIRNIKDWCHRSYKNS